MGRYPERHEKSVEGKAGGIIRGRECGRRQS